MRCMALHATCNGGWKALHLALHQGVFPRRGNPNATRNDPAVETGDFQDGFFRGVATVSKASRDKGKRGELEIARMIREGLGVTVERNLAQWRDGGTDLVPAGDPDGWDALDKAVAGFAWEVKNQASQSPARQWWAQTLSQAQAVSRVPVLAYKVPYRGWRFRVALADLGLPVPRDYEHTAVLGWDGMAALIRQRVVA